MTAVIGFPNPVNEKAARAVAAGVLILSVLTLLLGLFAGHGWLWLIAALAAGFVARVVTGPTLSPLGQFATRVVAPRLGAARLVAGPPKRFAQAIGATITVAGVAFLAGGMPTVTEALLGVLAIASGLEAVLGLCLGCRVFAGLMRLGVIPQEICAECSNLPIWRTAEAPAGSGTAA